MVFQITTKSRDRGSHSMGILLDWYGLADLIRTIFLMIGILFISQCSNPRQLITFRIRSILGCLKPRLEQSAMDPDQEAFLPPSSKTANKGRMNSFRAIFRIDTRNIGIILKSFNLNLWDTSRWVWPYNRRMCARRGHAKKHAGAMISLVALLAHPRGASLGRGARALFQLLRLVIF